MRSIKKGCIYVSVGVYVRGVSLVLGKVCCACVGEEEGIISKQWVEVSERVCKVCKKRVRSVTLHSRRVSVGVEWVGQQAFDFSTKRVLKKRSVNIMSLMPASATYHSATLPHPTHASRWPFQPMNPRSSLTSDYPSSSHPHPQSAVSD